MADKRPSCSESHFLPSQQSSQRYQCMLTRLFLFTTAFSSPFITLSVFVWWEEEGRGGEGGWDGVGSRTAPQQGANLVPLTPAAGEESPSDHTCLLELPCRYEEIFLLY